MFNLSPGLADKWFLASKSVNGLVESYVDKNSIKSNGNLVVFWMLNSYKEKLNVEDAIIFSDVGKVEGDCLRDAKKDLYIAFYDKKMGKGNIVAELKTPEKEWTYLKPSTVWGKVLKYVCENK